MDPIEVRLERYQRRVADALLRWLPDGSSPPRELYEAMRYATIDGGKRLRAVLVYAVGETLGASLDDLDAPACAVELVHAYSLVHDDLPAMDNDDLRRGKPTCHRVFGDATALLAGDALQSLAFQILAQYPSQAVNAAQRLKMIEALAVAASAEGMAGGQAIDLAAVGKTLTLPELENMHIRKTGALIRAAVSMGVITAGASDTDTARRLDHYAKCIGLAFQIRDDILDVEASTEELGKISGADQARNKPTYPALLGLAQAKREAEQMRDAALASIEPLRDNGRLLRDIAHYVIERSH